MRRTLAELKGAKTARRLLGYTAALFALLLAVTGCVSVTLPQPTVSSEPPIRPILQIENEMHTADIKSIGVDRENKYLVTSSYDKTVRVWDLSTGKLLRVLRPPIGQGDDGKLHTAAISPNGETIACAASASWDQFKSIYLFDRATGQMRNRVKGLSDSVASLAYSQDGQYLSCYSAGKGRCTSISNLRLRAGCPTS